MQHLPSRNRPGRASASSANQSGVEPIRGSATALVCGVVVEWAGSTQRRGAGANEWAIGQDDSAGTASTGERIEGHASGSSTASWWWTQARRKKDPALRPSL